MTSSDFDQFRSRLREAVKIADLLESTGHHIRRNGQGGGTTRCPFHDDHRPSLSVYGDKEGVERFRCFSCSVHKLPNANQQGYGRTASATSPMTRASSRGRDHIGQWLVGRSIQVTLRSSATPASQGQLCSLA